MEDKNSKLPESLNKLPLQQQAKALLLAALESKLMKNKEAKPNESPKEDKPQVDSFQP